MAGTTGLEPATSAVTGQRSDQLSYVPTSLFRHLVVCHIESGVSQKSLISLDSTFSLLWTGFLGFYRHQTDTKKTPKPAPQRQDQVYQMKVVFGVLSTLTEEKSSSSRSSLLRRARGDERDADLYLPGVRFAATRTDVI